MFAPLRRLLPLLAALPGVVLFTAPAWGQSQATALEEVVVTARKRDETIQNVPVTENVFTQQAIEAAGIESPRDFVAMVPNMTLVEGQNVGNSFITIRGISQARNSERSEEHTSELQSQSNLVCRLLLEKKKQRALLKTTT